MKVNLWRYEHRTEALATRSVFIVRIAAHLSIAITLTAASLFVGMGPMVANQAEPPQYVIGAIIEKGGYGAEGAAPVVKCLFGALPLSFRLSGSIALQSRHGLLDRFASPTLLLSSPVFVCGSLPLCHASNTRISHARCGGVRCLARCGFDESILQGFPEMLERDRVDAGQIGNRARHANDAMKRAR